MGVLEYAGRELYSRLQLLTYGKQDDRFLTKEQISENIYRDEINNNRNKFNNTDLEKQIVYNINGDINVESSASNIQDLLRDLSP
jgi:hypothetical protein